MKVYTTTAFAGHWPVPTAAVVCAESPEAACHVANMHLVSVGLTGSLKPTDMTHVNTRKQQCIILSDGDY